MKELMIEIFSTIVSLVLGGLAGYVLAYVTGLNQLLQTLTGASFIAAVGFIGKSLVDDDGDGVPDDWEKKKKETLK